jgi:N-acetylneuraminic acid mutarotase
LSLIAQGRQGRLARHPAPRSDTSPHDAAWQAVADLPVPLVDSCAVSINGNVYSFTGVSNGVITPNDYVFEGSDWSQIADFPDGGPEKPACAAVNGKAYITDGNTTDFTENDTLYIHDPSTDQFTTGADLPSSGSEFGAAGAALNGKFYVIGGCPGSDCSTMISRVTVYDPGSDSWSQAADYPTGIAWQGCAAAGANIVCAGGQMPSGSDTTATCVYDPGSDSWSQGAEMPYDNWGMAAVGTAGGNFVVTQGVTNGTATTTNQTAIYDVAADSWTSGPNNVVTTYRSSGACGFYAVGGMDSGNLFTGITSAELLPGFDTCGVGPASFLSFNPASGTVAAGGEASSTMTVDGTGQSAGTSTDVQVILSGGTYGNVVDPLHINWTSSD